MSQDNSKILFFYFGQPCRQAGRVKTKIDRGASAPHGNRLKSPHASKVMPLRWGSQGQGPRENDIEEWLGMIIEERIIEERFIEERNE